MKLAGLKAAVHKVLHTWKLSVDCLITDRLIQIRKYMSATHREKRKDKEEQCISHYIDRWHVAKSK